MIYEPAEDSLLLAKVLPRYVKKKSFLDMGAGSGVQADVARKAGARLVIAVDSNDEVAKNLRAQAIPFIHSNLFAKVKDRFDVIAFNPPYLPRDNREDKESQRATTGGKRGDEVICRFLRALPKKLTPHGICLLVLSSLTPRTRIKKILTKNKLQKKVIAKQSFFMETLEVWELRRKPQ